LNAQAHIKQKLNPGTTNKMIGKTNSGLACARSIISQVRNRLFRLVPVLAVIPVPDYERYFKGEDLLKYRRLLHQCEVMHLGWCGEGPTLAEHLARLTLEAEANDARADI
jgi:hypothetical protein